MLDRFTERAQEALRRAQQIALTKQHTQLDVEHIFLALMKQQNSLPAQIISRLGGDVEGIIRRTENALNNLPSFSSSRSAVGTGYITLRANRVIRGAAEEAERLNDDFISTEHMLLAIASERGGATTKILQEAGIEQEKIYMVLREIRGGGQTVDVANRRTAQKEKEIVNPPTLAKPVGFNHGIITTGGRLLFLAGQTATDAEGRVVAPGDVVGQYEQVLKNLQEVLRAAGGEMGDIVQMTIFVRDRDDYKAHLKELGKVHKAFFGAYYPATALLEVSRFFEDEVLVEIEGIAVLNSG